MTDVYVAIDCSLPHDDPEREKVVEFGSDEAAQRAIDAANAEVVNAAAAAQAADLPIPASVAVDTAVAAALAAITITSPNLTATQKNAIGVAVREQAQAVVDDHLDGS